MERLLASCAILLTVPACEGATASSPCDRHPDVQLPVRAAEAVPSGLPSIVIPAPQPDQPGVVAYADDLISRSFADGEVPVEVAVVADGRSRSEPVAAVVARLHELGTQRAWLVGRTPDDTCGALSVRLDPKSEAVVVPRGSSWESTFSSLRGDDALRWLTYPIAPQTCADVSDHASRRGLASPLKKHAAVARLARDLIAARGGRPASGDPWIQVDPFRTFWAGPTDPPPTFSFGSPDGAQVTLAPVGCAVFDLSTEEEPALDRVSGTIRLRVEVAGVEAEVATPTTVSLARAQPTPVELARVGGPPLQAAFAKALTKAEASPRRIEALRFLVDVWGQEAVEGLGAEFTRLPSEAHVFRSTSLPLEFALPTTTAVLGDLPLAVSLDGRAMSVEELPVTTTQYGRQLGRAVIPGEGTGQLSFQAGSMAEPIRLLVAWEPGAALYVTELGIPSKTRPGPRCISSDLPIHNRCGRWEAGAVAMPSPRCEGLAHRPTGPVWTFESSAGSATVAVLRPGHFRLDWRARRLHPVSLDCPLEP